MRALLTVFVAVLSLLTIGNSVFFAAPVNVEFWFHTSNVQETDAMAALVEKFNKENVDVQVELVNVAAASKAEFQEKLMTAIVGNVAPDLVYADPQLISEWGPAKGMFIPINKIAPVHLLEADDIMPAAKQVLYVRGVWWGLPFRTDSRGLFYNVDMAEKAGVDPSKPPKTISELDLWAQKLTIRDPMSNTYQQLGFFPYKHNDASGLLYLWMFGGEFFDWDALRPTLTKYPANLQATRWIQSYAERYGNLSPKSTDFINELHAMRIDSTSALASYPIQKPALRFLIGEIPVLEGQQPVTLTAGVSLGIPTGAKNPEAAFKFGLYLLSTDTQLAWWESARSLPVRLSAIRRMGSRVYDRRELVLVQLLPYGKTTPPMGNVIRDAFDKYQVQLRALTMTPEQVLQEAQREAELAYEETFPL